MSKTQKKASRSGNPAVVLRPGDKVIVKRNPHDPRSEGIVGTVMGYRAGMGFGGCDIVDVHYKPPSDGQSFTLAFGLSSLAAATPSELVRLAELHEGIASGMRSPADALGKAR